MYERGAGSLELILSQSVVQACIQLADSSHFQLHAVYGQGEKTTIRGSCWDNNIHLLIKGMDDPVCQELTSNFKCHITSLEQISNIWPHPVNHDPAPEYNETTKIFENLTDELGGTGRLQDLPKDVFDQGDVSCSDSSDSEADTGDDDRPLSDMDPHEYPESSQDKIKQNQGKLLISHLKKVTKYKGIRLLTEVSKEESTYNSSNSNNDGSLHKLQPTASHIKDEVHLVCPENDNQQHVKDDIEEEEPPDSQFTSVGINSEGLDQETKQEINDNYDSGTQHPPHSSDTDQMQPLIKSQGNQCHICGKKFDKLRHLKAHMGIHSTAEHRFNCSQCGKSFSRSSYLKTHEKRHGEESPCICTVCGKSFKNSTHLKEHSIFHRDKKTHKCTECEKSFFRGSDLKLHVMRHSGERKFKCSECNKAFYKSVQLKQHTMKFHSTGERPLGCTECDKRFVLPYDLKMHLKNVHFKVNSYLCTECSKSCPSAAALTIHMRSHTGERPFSCSQCDKKFVQQGNLSIHMRTHTGEKPFNCTECGKSFSSATAVKVHMKFHIGEKKNKCVICDKKFYAASYLKIHLRTHTGEKPDSCPYCDKKFLDKGGVRKHIRRIHPRDSAGDV